MQNYRGHGRDSINAKEWRSLRGKHGPRGPGTAGGSGDMGTAPSLSSSSTRLMTPLCCQFSAEARGLCACCCTCEGLHQSEEEGRKHKIQYQPHSLRILCFRRRPRSSDVCHRHNHSKNSIQDVLNLKQEPNLLGHSESTSFLWDAM